MSIIKIIIDLFLFPGRIIQWLNYMFPPKGKVRVTARHKNSLIIRVLWSVTFWICLYLIILKPVFEMHTQSTT